MNRLCGLLLAFSTWVAAGDSRAQDLSAPGHSASAASSASAAPSASAAAPASSASAAPAPGASSPQDDAQAREFVSRCSGCHTVGGGKLQGPDLLPATQWTDAQLRPAIKLMEKNVGPISNEDLDGLVALLHDPLVRDRITTAQRASMHQLESSLERPSPVIGVALFFGQRALSNGGLPCATCHQATGQGGSLGPDLTNVASKISGPALISAVHNASFNVMRAAYRDHPITQQEAVHIAAWLESVKAPPTASSSPVPWLGAVLGGLSVLVLAASLRPRDGVRARLVRRALRK